MATACDEAPPPDPNAEALVHEAFGHLRARTFAEARPIIDRAVALAPHDPYVAHARIHLATDTGNFAEGIADGSAYLTTHDPHAGINTHNTWHLADLLVEAGRPAEARDWFARIVVPSVTTYPVAFAGAVMLAWRLELSGEGRLAGYDLPWEALRDAAVAIAGLSPGEAEIDSATHALTCIAAGDAARLDAVRVGVSDADGRATISGLEAWWRGDHAAVVAQLEPHVATAGHYVQDTWVDACLRTGQGARVVALLRARVGGGTPLWPRTQARLGQALRQAGALTEASTLLRGARDAWVGADATGELAALDALLAA